LNFLSARTFNFACPKPSLKIATFPYTVHLIVVSGPLIARSKDHSLVLSCFPDLLEFSLVNRFAFGVVLPDGRENLWCSMASLVRIPDLLEFSEYFSWAIWFTFGIANV